MRPALPLTPALLALLAGPALADPLDDRAKRIFSTAFSEACLAAFQEDGSLIEQPQRFDLTIPWSHSEPEAAVLWQFRCNIGAYNVTDVFLLGTDMDGIVPLAVAQPTVLAVNEDPEDFESPLKDLKVTGWGTRMMGVNPAFDPATRMLSAAGYWRGLGDAYDAGTWELRDGGFQLRHYEVDASYDGEAKPQLVLDFP